eukprot:182164_1
MSKIAVSSKLPMISSKGPSHQPTIEAMFKNTPNVSLSSKVEIIQKPKKQDWECVPKDKDGVISFPSEPFKSWISEHCGKSVDDKAVHMVTKATSFFVSELARKSSKIASETKNPKESGEEKKGESELVYDNIAKHVHSQKKNVFLWDIIPERTSLRMEEKKAVLLAEKLKIREENLKKTEIKSSEIDAESSEIEYESENSGKPKAIEDQTAAN